jgi:hypothetical protein
MVKYWHRTLDTLGTLAGAVSLLGTEVAYIQCGRWQISPRPTADDAMPGSPTEFQVGRAHRRPQTGSESRVPSHVTWRDVNHAARAGPSRWGQAALRRHPNGPALSHLPVRVGVNISSINLLHRSTFNEGPALPHLRRAYMDRPGPS